MKKFAIIFACLLACTSVFAKPKYNGDLQVHTGIGLDSFTYSKLGRTADVNAVLFNLDAQSWNLIQLNDLISVGFMVGTDFGWGGVTKATISGLGSVNDNSCKDAFHWNIIAAPAVAFSFKPVKIQCSIGFDLGLVPGIGLNLYGENLFFSFPATFGLVTEVQAKFFPDKRFSPIAGYRFCITGSGRVKEYSRDSKISTEQDVSTGLFSSGVFYLGASLNW